jgi:hypothetical protein
MSIEPAVKAARVDGWLVERMAAPGVEMVIGAVRDPQFGMMVMVGLGGVFVEVLGDVAFRLVPIARHEAESMIDALQGRALLDGARGQAPVSRAALVDLLLAVGGEGGLLHRHGDAIAELDLNPVIVSADAAVVVDARVILAPMADTPAGTTSGADAAQVDYGRLFVPKSVAVLGASATDTSIANTFIRRMKKFGYAGSLWPIHPSAPEVEGLPAFRSLADTPGPVDYAYVAIGAARVADALAAGAGRLGFAQVISSGFGEVEEGRDLERGLVDVARSGGFRVIGPNCLGLYSPRGGVTFPDDAPRETGSIGVLAPSGGLSTDNVKRGQARGGQLDAVVQTVAQDVDQRVGQAFDHVLVGLGVFALDDQRNVLAQLLADVAHQAAEALEDGAHRQHAHLHDGVLHVLGDAVDDGVLGLDLAGQVALAVQGLGALGQVGQGQLAELVLVQRAPVAPVDEDQQGPAIAAPRKEIQRLQGILAIGQVGQMRMRLPRRFVSSSSRTRENITRVPSTDS